MIRSFDYYTARGGNPGRSTDPLADTASTAFTPLKRSVFRGPLSIAAEDDTPLETAEEATVDVGLLEAATSKEVASTERRLISSKSSCPKGFVDCYNGNLRDNTATSCFKACNNGEECCTEDNSCKYTTACIEKNSANPNCAGPNACYKVAYKGTNQPIISGGSCSGDSACYFLAYNSGSSSTSFVGSISKS